MENEKIQNNQHNIEEKNEIGGQKLLNFKTYYKAKVIKTVFHG